MSKFFILLLFDAHKLDISDEFKRTIEALKDHDEKIRVVLNKADTVDTQALMRVYGALMWSLGKVSGTPEVKRVYISSFWERPFQNTDNATLFEIERGGPVQGATGFAAVLGGAKADARRARMRLSAAINFC